MVRSKLPGKLWVKFILLAGLMLLASDLAAKEEMDYQGLPPGAGVDLVLENCTACHSTEIIRKNYMSHEAWDKTNLELICALRKICMYRSVCRLRYFNRF